jgi:predicted transcriptional regulator of viral defense system
MKLIDVLANLKKLEEPALRTADVMAHLKIKKDHASKLLSRLSLSGHIVRIKRGLWVFPKELDPLQLPEYLTAPFPSYISLQSALFYHGMISQIPTTTYSVSVARTQFFKTPLGTFSIHHVTPSFFFGYELVGKPGIKMATPEKALVDFLYMGPAKSKLFRSLPELDLPHKFSLRAARRMIRRIDFPRRRSLVEKRFQDLMSESKPPGKTRSTLKR